MSSTTEVQFKARAPRFLWRAYERLISEEPDKAQALRDWIYFFEASLRYVYFVMDAEAAALEVPRGDRASRVLDRNLGVSLGTLATGVWGLTDRLRGKTTRLAALVDVLDEARVKDFVNQFVDRRNRWSHRELAVTGAARSHLAELRPHRPLFTQMLASIDGFLTVAVVTQTPSLGKARTHLLRDSDRLRCTVMGHVDAGRPFLHWPNGDALSLWPGLMMGPRDTFQLVWDVRDGQLEVVAEDGQPRPWAGDTQNFPRGLTRLFDQARADGVLRTGLLPLKGEVSLSPDAPVLPEGFEVLEKLGEGGVGAVWKARWNQRLVAVKVLHPFIASDPEAQERLFREAQALQKVQAPGVVEVLHPGWETEDGRFVVMEFLGGGDLARVAPTTADRAVELCGSLLRTLYAVHGNGIIHRDVKPSNVLLDDAGVPHLVDFSIARDQANATITLQDHRLGTPAFWAPEQAGGDAVSKATDLFAVARLLGFLVTDQVTREAHLAALPSGLQAIYRRATEDTPQRRYAQAQDMLRALKASAKAKHSGSPLHNGAVIAGRLVATDDGEACGSCWVHTVVDDEGERAILISPWNTAGHEALKTAAKKADRPVEKHDGLAFVQLPSRADAKKFLAGESVEWSAAQVAGVAAAGVALGGLAVLGAGLASTLLGNKKARAGAAAGLAAALGAQAAKKKGAAKKLPVGNAPYLAGFTVKTTDPVALRRRLGTLLMIRIAQTQADTLTKAQWLRVAGDPAAALMRALLQTDKGVARALASRHPLNAAQMRRVSAWAQKLLGQVSATQVPASALAPFIVQTRQGWRMLTPQGHRPLWS